MDKFLHNFAIFIARVFRFAVPAKGRHFVSLGVVLVSTLLLAAPSRPVLADWTNGMNATSVIGQYDAGGTPTISTLFTKGGPNDSARRTDIRTPDAIAIDSVNHRLFVAGGVQSEYSRIFVYNLDAQDIPLDQYPDFVLGQPDFNSRTNTDTNGMSATRFNVYPSQGIAYDPTGNRLFVIDMFNHRVMVFDVSTITNGEAAVNVLGQADFTSNSANITQSGMTYPAGIAYDDGTDRLYVADGAQRVLIFDAAAITDGENAVNVLGQTDFTSNSDAVTQSKLTNPTGLAIDEAGDRLFVSDSGAHRVMVFDIAAITDGEAAINVLGQTNFTSGGTTVSQIGMSSPSKLAYDTTGSLLYVAQQYNGHRVTVFDVTAITDGEAAINVLGRADYVTASSPPPAITQASLNVPSGIALSGDGNQLYVSSQQEARVMRFDVTAITDGENAVGELGQCDQTVIDGSCAAVFDDVTFPGNGASRFGIESPQAVIVDKTNHRLYVADFGNMRVLIHDLDSNDDLVDYAPDHVLGQLDFNDILSAGTTAARFTPTDIALDVAANRLYVADTAGNRVLVFDVTAITDGEAAVNVLGQANFTSSGTGLSSTQFNAIGHIALDEGGDRLFVTDQNNNRVMVFDVAAITDGEAAVNVLGQPDFTTNTAGTTASIMSSPGRALEYDATNNRLFASDQNGTRILIYNVAAITDGEAAVNVLGQTDFVSSGGGTSANQFNPADGIKFDGTRDLLYVGQGGGASRVMIYDLSCGVTDGMNAVRVLGANNLTTSVTGTTQARFNNVSNVEVDTVKNRLYVADRDNNRLMIFEGGSWSAVCGVVGPAATNVLGQADFTSNVSATTQAGMDNTGGTALDTAGGRLFVADAPNNRVLVFNVANGLTNGEAAVNVLGQTDFVSGGDAVTQTGMSLPIGLAYDSVNQRLFVVQNTGHRVTVYDVTTITNGEAAINVLGQVDFTSSASATTSTGLHTPIGAAYDSGTSRLYVAAAGNNRVTVYDVAAITDGEAAINVLGQPDFTSSAGATTQSGLSQPYGVGIDPTDDRLFVADTANSRIMVFDVASITNGEAAINVLGQADFVSSASATTQGRLSSPASASYGDEEDHLYVADYLNNRVLRYDLSSGITNGMNASAIYGQGLYTTADTALTQTGMNAPLGVTYDGAARDIYVSDYTNRRVLYFNLPAQAINVLGQPDFVTASAATTSVKMSAPGGSSFDAANDRLFVPEITNRRVLVFDAAAITNGEAATYVLGQADFTSTTNATTQSGMSGAPDTAYDSTTQRLYVADYLNHRVLVYDLSGGITNGMNASYVIGQPDFTSNTPSTTQSSITQPLGIDVDSTNQRLFVADTGGSRVMVFDVSTIVNGENAVYVLGAPDFVTGGNAVTQDGLGNTYGVHYASTTELLYVADQQNNRVMVFDVASITNGEAAVNVLGQPDFVSSSTGLTQSGMTSPTTAVYDSVNEQLFIAEFNVSNRVLVFDLSGGITNGMNASSVLGQPDFVTGTATTAQSGLAAPLGLSYDAANGHLFVSEYSNNRVTVWDFADAPVVPPPSGGGGGPAPDTAAPIISGITVSAITETGAAVAWDTNEASTSLVRYGTTAGYGSTNSDTGAYLVAHSRSLTGLVAGTTYHFQVCSTDSAANQACSADGTFSTSAAVVLPPPPPPPPPADETAPGTVTGFTATWDGTRVNLSWTNPVDTDLAGVLIRRSTTSAPTTTTGGTFVFRSNGSFTTDSAVSAGTTYHYSAFAYDEVPNYSSRATTSVSVPAADVVPPPVVPPPEPPVTEPPPVEPTTPPEPVPPTTPPATPPTTPESPSEPGTPGTPGTPGATAPGTSGTEPGGASPATPPEPIYGSGQLATCGNGICESTETATSCPVDCGESRYPTVTAPATSGGEANLLYTDDIRFFGGNADVRLSLDGGSLAITPRTGIKVYVPDEAIRKEMSRVWMTVGTASYELQPTGSYTGYFSAPSTYGDQAMSLTANYADGTHDTVSFTISVRPPGQIYETVDGETRPVSGARVTLLDAAGGELAVWDGTGQLNPVVAGSSGDYAFLVSSGTYKLQIEKPGYATRTTLAFRASNVVAQSVELVKLPEQTPLAEIAFAAKVASVEIRDFGQNPIVQERAETTSSFILTAGVLNAAAAGAATGTAVPYLMYLASLFVQPTQIIARRNRKKWGVVYNAFTKLPVDLAIVRVSDAATGRIVRSAVTDKLGRYFFIVAPGEYTLSVVKASFSFPSAALAGQSSDAKFLDLNHGEKIVTGPDGSITVNLPVDPIVAEKIPTRIVAEGIARRAQSSLGLLAVGGIAVVAAITQSRQMLAILVANIVAYAIFKRLATQKSPKRWGVVRDAAGKSVQNAIARIFDTRYNKLLETQVTDIRGQYAFLVGRNSYVVTVEKPGFAKAQYGPVDLSASQNDEDFIAQDVILGQP